MALFRRSEPTEPATSSPDPSAPADPRAPKGRPTPSRKEAEAARKQALKGVPSDPKEARRQAREQDRADRAAARAALMSGDGKNLPARDAGPVRQYVRDFVDSRWTTAEYFIFIALGVLILGFVRNATLQFWVSMLWFAFTAVIILDTAYLLWRLSSELKQRWPDRADRKGTTFYALLRCLQLRKLRLPPPRIKRGQPVPEPARR